jgi:methionine biosynthesis protein MetW
VTDGAIQELREGEALLALRQQRAERGDAFPRIGVFLFGGPDRESLRKTLERIPEGLDDCLAQVVVVEDAERQEPPFRIQDLAVRSSLRLRIHREPSDPSFGGARKAALEYARQMQLDRVVTMRGDGRHPPELLPALLLAALEEPAPLVIAARVHRLAARPEGLWVARLLAHRLATGFQNRLLGLALDDYHSGYRVYPSEALRSIPFQLNTSTPSFDMQLLIQCRALGVPVREVRVPPSWKEHSGDRRGLQEVLRACGTVLQYRLHQLHVIRHGPYFVDQGVHYTLKRARSGSHMQVIDAIAPGARVLDLGCSQGLLARPLREKDVRVVGVDVHPAERLARELEAYFQRDLEQPLDLPFGREFDYVVVADVIEHLRRRVELLRQARRFLKVGGRLIISTPNVALWFYRASLLAGRFEYGPRGILDETHLHLYTRASFRRAVERAGFRVVSERVTSLPFEVVFESTGRSRLVRFMGDAYHLLARAWPELFAYQVILEAEIATLDEEAIAPGAPVRGSPAAC